jgi:spermidine synthase
LVFAPADGTIFTWELVSCKIAGVKAMEMLGQARAQDGAVLKLMRRGDEYIILAGGKPLMSSRMHGSEEALATFGCRKARMLKRPRVLVGGLGMGFTLRAALDLLPAGATVVVAELLDAVVEWNRGPLGELAGHPLNDSRVRVEIGDVSGVLRARHEEFDAVLLDVDNGPAAFTQSENAGIYDDRGIREISAALKADGVVAVWSAHEDRKFEARLRHGGFEVEAERVRGRMKKGGPQHLIFWGWKRAGP